MRLIYKSYSGIPLIIITINDRLQVLKLLYGAAEIHVFRIMNIPDLCNRSLCDIIKFSILRDLLAQTSTPHPLST